LRWGHLKGRNDRDIVIAAGGYLNKSRIATTVDPAAGVRFMVHENFRWQPWYRKIKEVQKSQTIGDFTHIHLLTRFGDGWGENAYLDRQPFFRDYPQLLIYETGIHFIDTFRFLLGEVTPCGQKIQTC
jgi:predicted dehydrogenase